MKKIIITDDIVNLQDFDDEIKEDEDIEITKDGKTEIKKIKKTELFDATIIRVFKHSPNSFEWGKAGARHKINYYSEEDAKKKIDTAKRIDDYQKNAFEV
jgi:hypothetical protein